MKLPVENVFKKSPVNSAEIDCLSFQQNHSLNIFLTSNVSNILVFLQKYFVMVIQQTLKKIMVI